MAARDPREREPGLTFSPAAANPFSLPGSPFTYVPHTATGPGGGADPNDPFSMFDDPSTKYLTDIIKQQIGDYSKPVSMDGDTAGVLAWLKGQMAGGVTSGAGNGLLGDFITQGRQRITELNQEPFSAGEENALRTKAKDQLTIDRDAQRQMALEDISRRGVDDSSGVLQERYANIDRAYAGADSKAMNDLMLFIAQQRQDRKDKATGIAGQLATAGAADAQMQNSAWEASAGRLMQAATTIANLQAQQRGETRANQQQVLNLAAMLAQLPVDRLNMMLSIVNGTGGGANGLNSLFGNTLALSNSQQSAQNQQNAGQAAFINGLAEVASYYANRGKGGGK